MDNKYEDVKIKEHQVVAICKQCKTQMNQGDKCSCRPHLCYRCCNCGFDCNLCNCSHKPDNIK